MEPEELQEQDPVALFMSLDDWPSNEVYLVGFVMANIVGVQYYSGRITGRELVGLVREPLNPFDSNAIKVLNTRSVQVGHVERSVAAVLSPLIDNSRIIVEGIVPNSRSNGNRYRIPCQIHIFAKYEDFDGVKANLSSGGLILIENSNAGIGLSEAMVVKEKYKKMESRSLDDIFKLVDENLSKERKMGVLEPPESMITSELFPHQKEGLWWLVDRETSNRLPPFWEEKNGEYVNILTNYHTSKRPEPLRGGILADDMGLGKTLSLLSLIAFDKFNIENGFDGEVGKGEEGVAVSSGKKGKRAKVSRKGTGGRKRCKFESNILDTNAEGKSMAVADSSDALASKTTLIVCPPAVFSTWITQLEQHTKRGSFKVYMYYGERTNDVEELKKYDLVLTTYSTLTVEYSSLDSPLNKIEWWRIILDEAHLIKNVNAQQSRAVTSLKAKRRWVVTGTPIQNGYLDLYSLMAFLRFEPFSIKSYWQTLVQRPLAQGNKQGLSRLQVLMATISLRRTKDKDLVGLPSKTIETHYIELSQDERELYDQLEGKAKGVVQEFINAGNVTRCYSTVLCMIVRLRQICDDLALCPSDLISVLPSNNIEDVSNNAELLKKVVTVLQDAEDFDCPICISPPTNAVITRCAHIYCRSCIIRTLQRTKPCCPLCRHPLSLSDLFAAPDVSSDSKESEISSSRISSKVSVLLQLLIASRTENPTRKSVVFSQFQKMLLLLEEPLRAAGFKILRLDGSMNAKKRTQVIKEFEMPGPEAPTILLASLKASGAGVNLTAASSVYLFEPWWNPAVEEQAMDRVHRIGQKENVKIVRLIAQNSIEVRILEMQERKKKLAKEALGKQVQKAYTDFTIDDLCALVSL
ncbi:hypothetical protein K2173_010804 [Erythroxylum novogranatense]|uniref:SWI/SNF-related matrix-associated actin-dependent regulator of chromatin subfamily A member 3-like 1 n=1 Tax=Erythroxylum novogranatense TaxID=1862640 RepID=A0AAV8T0Z8_9ROSI|nr:hypothetical protein K2173_010804 [Erythroxylum novogranatense]